MCLFCAFNSSNLRNVAVTGEKNLKKALMFYPKQIYLHTHDNKIIHLNERQINEIIKHAILIIVTGVDFNLDIWAIQWPKDYIVGYDDIPIIPINKAKMSTRCYNVLTIQMNCKTLQDVSKYSYDDLLRIRYLGKHTLDEIKQILKENNLSLAKK